MSKKQAWLVRIAGIITLLLLIAATVYLATRDSGTVIRLPGPLIDPSSSSSPTPTKV